MKEDCNYRVAIQLAAEQCELFQSTIQSKQIIFMVKCLNYNKTRLNASSQCWQVNAGTTRRRERTELRFTFSRVTSLRTDQPK